MNIPQLTQFEKVKAISLAIVDFIVPIKPLDLPIKGYSQRTRVQARKWRMRGGLAIHTFLIAGLAMEFSGLPLVAYELVNAIAMMATLLNFGGATHRISEFRLNKVRRMFK